MTPFSIPSESISGYIFDANLVILVQICHALSHGQADLSRILSKNGQNDLVGQGQWALFPIAVESIPWCMFGTNLVILAQNYDDISCGKDKVCGQTDERTDREMDRRRQRQYPSSLKGQRVKTMHLKLYVLNCFEEICTNIFAFLSSFLNTDTVKLFPRGKQGPVHILQGQYHGSWYPGNARSQGISSHNIDSVRQEYYSGLRVGSRLLSCSLCFWMCRSVNEDSLTARFMGPTWDPPGAEKTQVGPIRT